MRKLLLPTAIGAAGLLLGLASLWWRYAGFAGETFVDIPARTSSWQIGRLLADAGVIRYRWQFWLARALKPRTRLHYGEYRFQAPASTWEVFERVARGDVFYYLLTVPEGSNMFDIAAAVEQLGVMTAAELLRQARDPSLIRDLAPRAPSLEGYLFPDTYRITRRATAYDLCRQMTERFRQAWASLKTVADVHETVTLASLIEKETALPHERPLVASVFLNRLKLGMPLACDPTAIYAALLEDRYRGTLYRSDLESMHRYNTYRHAGLPPGPIANPGLESLKAALNPAQTDYLYFVALPDGSGAHQFSRDLASHQRAVARYRRGQKANHRAKPPG
ncbi:MAG: endolytic transglycosylase MltG [Bryobacteraceae bacterium]